MELNSSAQELLTRAQMLRLCHNSGDLTQEHILLAALSADDEGYLDAEDAAELQAVLSALLTDAAEARAELQNRLNSGDLPAESDGMAVIAAAGDRAERRNDGVITPALLCEALFESPSPLIRTLMRGDPAATVYEQEDDVTVSEQLPFAGSPISGSSSNDCSDPWEESEDSVLSDEDEDDEDEDDEDDDDEDDSDITDSDIRHFLSALAHAMESESVEVKPNSRKKKTKLGWFTFRGGTFAAAVQYFLLCAVLLFGGLLAVELAFGWLNDPPSHLAAFLVEAYIALWVYAALKGASLLLGQISNAFGNFLMTLSHMAFAFMLATAVADGWQLVVWPIWLKTVLSVVLVLILQVHTTLYEYLNDQSRPFTTKISFKETTGSAGKLFFEQLSKTIKWPMTVALCVWVLGKTPAPWLQKVFWIAGFFLVYGIVNNIWVILAKKKEASRKSGGEKLVKFAMFFHVLMVVPLLILYLHWVFAWTPMRMVVKIIVGMWTVASLVLSAVAGFSDGSDLMI